MPKLATSPLAPILGRHFPVRGPGRLLYRSYAKLARSSGGSVRNLSTTTGDMFEADLSSLLEWQLWAFGSYEEHLGDLFRYLVGTGDRCIDVGANIGIHTVRLAKLVGEQGEVIALEADAQLAHRTQKNIKMNDLRNVTLITAAATDNGGQSVVLHRPAAGDSNKGRASLLPHDYLTGSKEEVATTTVDEVNNKPVALIKIDVEGFEAAVIAGAIRTIRAFAPAIIFEYAPEMLADAADSPFDRLMEMGYNLLKINMRRNALTRGGILQLERCQTLPSGGTNLLAVSDKRIPQIESLIH
jgi:FkbM family methyltransferase